MRLYAYLGTQLRQVCMEPPYAWSACMRLYPHPYARLYPHPYAYPYAYPYACLYAYLYAYLSSIPTPMHTSMLCIPAPNGGSRHAISRVDLGRRTSGS